MNHLVPLSAPLSPALVTAAGEHAGIRFLEFLKTGPTTTQPRRCE